MRKRILIISYYFPPLGSIGHRRPLKFAKYLPYYGWESFVLTVKKGVDKIVEMSLIKEIPEGVSVYRTPSLEPFRYRNPLYEKIEPEKKESLIRSPRMYIFYILKGIRIILSKFMIPDERIGWLPFAVISGLKIIKSKKIDLIFVTSPPSTSLLIGYLLNKLTKTPLIIDYRDPWTFNPFFAYTSRFRERLENRLEYKVIKNASKGIVISRQMEEVFKNNYLEFCHKFTTITNGFDEEDFISCKPERFDKFTIVYSGTFYGKRTPLYFLKALKKLNEENEEFRENSQFLFFGDIDKDIERLLLEQGLMDLINSSIGYLPYKENIKYIMGADVLVLIIGAKSKLTVTGKVFDYIAARRPILALVPDGAASEIIKETGTGVVVPPEDVDAIKSKILEIYEKYKRDKEYPVDYKEAQVKQYSYSFLTKQVATLLDCLLKQE